jgi:hypothetical protein
MASQSAREARRKVLRIRCSTQVYTAASVQVACMASGRPLNPSHTTMHTSPTPRFFNSGEHPQPELGALAGPHSLMRDTRSLHQTQGGSDLVVEQDAAQLAVVLPGAPDVADLPFGGG